MKRFRLASLTGLMTAGMLAPMIAMQPAPAQALKVGYCPSGYKLEIRNNTATCSRKVRKRIKVYRNYKPCVRPGVYRRGDEAPGSGGKDRCTAGGISGPSLACPVGTRREIRRRKVDRCYRYVVRTIRRRTDIKVR